VYDVARACRLALEVDAADGQALNVGSGRAYTVVQVSSLLAEVLGTAIEPDVCGKYRVGDIRHCFADISRARAVLGYEPLVPLEQGIIELAEWLKGQVAHDRVAEARAQLTSRGLTV
jgi:dTDP-L-rhamnose 4-epimerase